MEFVKQLHPHTLVLNEHYHGNEGDICYLCRQPILPSPFAQSVYRCIRGIKSSVKSNHFVDCDKLFVHKSCASLPLEITDYYLHPQHPITFTSTQTDYYATLYKCCICSRYTFGVGFYLCNLCDLRVCLKCVTSPPVHHPSHNQHALSIIQRQASFRCDACGREASDTSSCKCTICPFWIHTSCAILSSSSSFQSQFHKHPLLMAYSFPQQFLQFQHRCKICREVVKPTLWLYYCSGCRIFVHFQCAHSPPQTTIRPPDEFGDLVHLPTRDESSLNMLRQLLIHQMIINQGVEGDALTLSFSSISTVTSADVAGPSKEVIHHWSHDQHPLILSNKCNTPNMQLMALKEDNDKDSDDDSTIIVCDGCTNPINSSNTSYYECHPCKYFLHRNCAELPKQIKPYKYQHYDENPREILFTKISSSNLFRCNGCNYLKSGIYIANDDGFYKLDIGCAMLLRKIKHEAHEHPLNRVIAREYYYTCNACSRALGTKELNFKCGYCQYYLHTQCALRPHKLKHPWDSHPLTLITPENIIEDHPHDFNCEHCSEDIDSNLWFYHCSLCDLSCHIDCINMFNRYSCINFRSSETKIDQQLYQKFHDHGLKLVFSKRKRCCGSCHSQLFYMPILRCTKCNFIICLSCVYANQFNSFFNFWTDRRDQFD